MGSSRLKLKGKILNKVSKSLRKYQSSVLAIEEISELISEISLLLDGEGDYDDLCEEVADVRIMIGLVMTTFHIKDSEVKESKSKMKKDFKKKSSSRSNKANLKNCILELSKLQKVICKKSRGRKNHKDIIDAIASVELSIGYIASKKFISEKDCMKWEKKKLKRMQKRIHKNSIV